MGGTVRSTGVYDENDHVQDRGHIYNNGLHLSLDSIIDGEKAAPMLNNAFTRFHQSIVDYPMELDNMDDFKLYQTDNFERLKPLMPKKGSTVGTTTLIPTMDTDEKLIWYDTQGESLYTNPPDPNHPTIDHGLDEDHIWAFSKTNYNQNVIRNPYTRDLMGALKEHNAPWWGKKLLAPAWYKEDKYTKFLEHYAIKLDFQRLLMRHANELRPGDMVQRDQMKSEVAEFMKNAEQKQLEKSMKDVYVTDHKPVAKKYSTLSEEEDMEYYEYVRGLQEYNKKQMKGDRVSRFESGRFERGSMKQRLLEPLAGAVKLDNGTTFYEVTEKEIARQIDQDRLRAIFDRASGQEPMEGGDEAEIRAALYDEAMEAGYDIEEWDQILARELDTFKAGEKYDYATDLRRTFDSSLSESLETKIFKRLPAHVFWDIKTPRGNAKQEMYLNPYNTARKYPFETFFDMRNHEDWLQSRSEQRNLTNNISRHNRI